MFLERYRRYMQGGGIYYYYGTRRILRLHRVRGSRARKDPRRQTEARMMVARVKRGGSEDDLQSDQSFGGVVMVII